LGQGQLKENAADVGPAVQLLYFAYQIILCALRRQDDVLRPDADAGTCGVLEPDVHLRGRILSHQDSCQAGNDPPPGQLLHPLSRLGLHISRQGFSIDYHIRSIPNWISGQVRIERETAAQLLHLCSH